MQKPVINWQLLPLTLISIFIINCHQQQLSSINIKSVTVKIRTTLFIIRKNYFCLTIF